MLLALATAAIIAYGVVGRRSSPSPSTPAASPTVAEPPPLASSAALVTTSAPPAGPDPSALRARAAEAAALAAERRHNEIFVPGGVTQLPAGERDVAPFYLDRQEVTVRRFAECTLARACINRRLQGPTVEAPELPRSASCNWHQVGREDHPMNCVSFAQAESYCRWRSARLPSEAEWVRAARGDDARRLPWGNEPASCDRTVMADADGEGCGRGTSWTAGTRPEDVSAFGALDLGGNLREWVADAADASGATRLVKGGGYADTDPSHLQIDARRASAPSERSSQVGFRCARSVR
jgi:serine/threonine-protein kinase